MAVRGTRPGVECVQGELGGVVVVHLVDVVLYVLAVDELSVWEVRAE
jgi:hypothetical protein